MSSSRLTVRVMTWNIHSGFGPDRRFDLARVVAAITRNRPDVVALQEVDSRHTVPPAASAFAVLREAVGPHGVEASSILTADGAYGQMVLSRWPFAADFNEWFWPASLRGALGRELPARTQHATFPSWYPLLRLDRIFCWRPGAMRASFVDRDARSASDHLPVIADVEIDLASNPPPRNG